MTTKHKVVPMEFDSAAWAIIVQRACDMIDIQVLADMLGVSVGCVKHWRNNKYPDGFEYPSMTNFIRACNLLDADPRDFFVLREAE